MIEKLTRRKVHKLIVRTALGTVSYPHHPRSHVIEDLQTDSKQHLHDSQSDGHLHLVRVGEDQLVLGHVPDRVHSKWVRGHALHSLTGDPQAQTGHTAGLDSTRVRHWPTDCKHKLSQSPDAKCCQLNTTAREIITKKSLSTCTDTQTVPPRVTTYLKVLLV